MIIVIIIVIIIIEIVEMYLATIYHMKDNELIKMLVHIRLPSNQP